MAGLHGNPLFTHADRIRAFGLYFATAGGNSMVHTFVECSPATRESFDPAMYGSLDAPHYLPAGAMNSTDATDFKRRPVAAQTTTVRGES